MDHIQMSLLVVNITYCPYNFIPYMNQLVTAIWAHSQWTELKILRSFSQGAILR